MTKMQKAAYLHSGNNHPNRISQQDIYAPEMGKLQRSEKQKWKRCSSYTITTILENFLKSVL